MICDAGTAYNMCKYFGTPFKWLFCHFRQVLYDKEAWSEVLPEFHESYYDMSVVCKLLFCCGLIREDDYHTGTDGTCLEAILSRVKSILNLIDADSKDYGDIPNHYVFEAFLSESGKWDIEEGLYANFEMLLLDGRITNMDECPNDYIQ